MDANIGPLDAEEEALDLIDLCCSLLCPIRHRMVHLFMLVEARQIGVAGVFIGNDRGSAVDIMLEADHADDSRSALRLHSLA